MLTSELQWALQERLQAMATQERATRIVPHVAQEDHAALLESIELHLAAALAAAYVLSRRR